MSIDLNKQVSNRRSEAGYYGGASGSERRQMTVMFADLVGSTGLMEALGAEDFSDMLSIYHTICNEAVRAGGGVVAQFLGDGVVCYFGYPHASETDAVRAISAALEILRETTSARLPSDKMKIETRIGIATGPVVFGGSKSHFGDDAVGACLNKAARLEGLAEVGTAVTCADTRKLVGNHFDFADLGEMELKGFEGGQQVYKVLRQKSGVSYRFDALRGRLDTALVGRDKELKRLLDSVDHARDQKPQYTVVSGTAGLGKSKLINKFRNDVKVSNSRVFMLQCSPEHSNTALYPVKSYLAWAAGANAFDDPEVLHDKLKRLFSKVWGADEEQLDLLLDLLSPLGSGKPQDESVSVPLKRRMMFSTLSDMVFKFGEAGDVLIFIVEDGHWIDPSSAEFLQTLRSMSDGKRISSLYLSAT